LQQQEIDQGVTDILSTKVYDFKAEDGGGGWGTPFRTEVAEEKGPKSRGKEIRIKEAWGWYSNAHTSI